MKEWNIRPMLLRACWKTWDSLEKWSALSSHMTFKLVSPHSRPYQLIPECIGNHFLGAFHLFRSIFGYFMSLVYITKWLLFLKLRFSTFDNETSGFIQFQIIFHHIKITLIGLKSRTNHRCPADKLSDKS